MKITVIAFVLMISSVLSAQKEKIIGSWIGTPEGVPIEMIIHIEEKENKLVATLDIPKQSAKGIALSEISLKNDSLFFGLKAIGFTYKGIIKDSLIEGIFSQNGGNFNLNFKPLIGELKAIKRQQTPSKPYGYYTEEVTFLNKRDNISLSGTVSLPKKDGHFPMVVLISGSGPQDRNSEVFEHKLFLVAADYTN